MFLLCCTIIEFGHQSRHCLEIIPVDGITDQSFEVKPTGSWNSHRIMNQTLDQDAWVDAGCQLMWGTTGKYRQYGCNPTEKQELNDAL